MANIGRFFCVAIPFLLTLGSLIALLVAGLAGVANKDLFMFQINTTGLSINPNDISSLVSTRGVPATGFHSHELLTTNITAADLDLADLYDVSLWGYCMTSSGTRNCSKPEFDWASTLLNSSTSLATSSGQNVTLPTNIQDALKAFASLTKWTEVVFIIAYICLGVELFFGLFAECSRAWACVTWLVAGVATVAVCSAAGLATAMSVVVVGTVEATAKWYGVLSSFNSKFLAAVWIAALFALAAGFFWLFTICCCKPDHRRRRGDRFGKSRHVDEAGEKLMPTGAYQALAHEGEPAGLYNPAAAAQYGGPRYPQGPRSDMAYEPYSHARV